MARVYRNWLNIEAPLTSDFGRFLEMYGTRIDSHGKKIDFQEVYDFVAGFRGDYFLPSLASERGNVLVPHNLPCEPAAEDRIYTGKMIFPENNEDFANLLIRKYALVSIESMGIGEIFRRKIKRRGIARPIDLFMDPLQQIRLKLR